MGCDSSKEAQVLANHNTANNNASNSNSDDEQPEAAEGKLTLLILFFFFFMFDWLYLSSSLFVCHVLHDLWITHSEAILVDY